jgi:homopolymeric O-antigen transport system permease protein
MSSPLPGSHATTRRAESRRADAEWFGLIWTLVRTDFKVRYHGTIMGFLWALLRPLTIVLVLMGVFSFIFGGSPNYAANLVVGLLLYEFFSDATKTGLGSLQSKGFLLAKTTAPPWILVVTSISNAVITLVVISVVFLGALALFTHLPSLLNLALFTWYAFQYIAMVIGISLASSVLFLRYRDLHEVWDVVTQAGFFVAPIIYPLEILPEHFHKYLYLWPPTPIIQFSRQVLVAGTVPTFKAHLLLLGETSAVLLIGWLIFRRYARRSAEYI